MVVYHQRRLTHGFSLAESLGFVISASRPKCFYIWLWLWSQFQAYICKNLRISCLAAPFSSHAFANSTFNFSALLLTSCPFSLRHKSIVCRTSIPTASRVPVGVSPFLYSGLSPSSLLTWKSSKPAWRFSATCTAATGWSARRGQ